MGGDAILAIVGDADGDVEEFLGQRIESAWRHDGLQILPGALEQCGIVGDGFPEIVDVIGLAGSHDVVVNGFDGGAGILVLDQSERRHEILSVKQGKPRSMLAGKPGTFQGAVQRDGHGPDRNPCFSFIKSI